MSGVASSTIGRSAAGSESAVPRWLLLLTTIILVVLGAGVSTAQARNSTSRPTGAYAYDAISTSTTSIANIAAGAAGTIRLTAESSGSGLLGAGSAVAAEEGFAPIASGSQLEDFASSGREIDPNGGGQLTRADRGYAKASEVFGPTSGGPAEINTAGQTALEEIVGNPGTTQTIRQGGRFAGGSQFVSPDGIGAVFDPDGNFQFFGRMAP